MATTTELSVGDKAPAFDAQDESGKRHTLAGYKGKTVVLYFYPKDNTPGCTVESCDFRDNHAAYLKKGAIVLGVSADSAKSHQGFKAKQNLPFPLLVDEDKKILSAYGVWQEKSMYGRKFMGIVRSTFVIGPDGKLAQVHRKVSVPGHVKQILETL
jgi:thioredoxin-dependent peroxiredoxin